MMLTIPANGLPMRSDRPSQSASHKVAISARVIASKPVAPGDHSRYRLPLEQPLPTDWER